MQGAPFEGLRDPFNRPKMLGKHHMPRLDLVECKRLFAPIKPWLLIYGIRHRTSVELYFGSQILARPCKMVWIVHRVQAIKRFIKAIIPANK